MKYRGLNDPLFDFQLTGLFQFTVRLASETEARFTSVERIDHYIKVFKTFFHCLFINCTVLMSFAYRKALLSVHYVLIVTSLVLVIKLLGHKHLDVCGISETSILNSVGTNSFLNKC